MLSLDGCRAGIDAGMGWMLDWDGMDDGLRWMLDWDVMGAGPGLMSGWDGCWAGMLSWMLGLVG